VTVEHDLQTLTRTELRGKYPVIARLWSRINHHPEVQVVLAKKVVGPVLEPAWRDWLTFCRYVLTELGERPTPEHSLDRTDNSRGYVAGNVAWKSKTEQANNRHRGPWPNTAAGRAWETAWNSRGRLASLGHEGVAGLTREQWWAREIRAELQRLSANAGPGDSGARYTYLRELLPHADLAEIAADAARARAAHARRFAHQDPTDEPEDEPEDDPACGRMSGWYPEDPQV